MSATPDEPGKPSTFFVSQLPALTRVAGDGPLLDLACGRGRHALAAARAGLQVVGVDRNAAALEQLARHEIPGRGSIETLVVDLETGGTPELRIENFPAIVVSRYLHRPLMPWIEGLLAPGGLLLYETFLVTQRDLGWGPTRADFLLERDELPRLLPKLEILIHEQGASGDDPPAATARLLARRPG